MYGSILAFSKDGDVEDVTQSTPRVVTKRTKNGQVFSNISLITSIAF